MASHPDATGPVRQAGRRTLDVRRSQSYRTATQLNKTLSTTQPITKYYALNHQLLSAFDTLFSTEMHQVAYAIGMQFVETALLEIPKHGYFYSPRHEKDRTQSSNEALRVTELLENILNEETNEIKKRAQQEERDRLSKLQKLALEQQAATTTGGTPDTALRKKYEAQRSSIEEEFRTQKQKRGQTSADSPWDQDFLACCGNDFFDITQFLTSTKVKERDATRNQKTEAKNSNFKSSFHYYEMDFVDQGGYGSDQQAEEREKLDMERALFLSGLTNTSFNSASFVSDGSVGMTQLNRSQTSPAEMTGRQHNLSKSIVDQQLVNMQSLTATYYDQFITLLNTSLVSITRVETYQGRLAGSINGCTVIAPLLCIHHFYSQDDGDADEHGLPSQTIMAVIDEETPAILPEVRNKLGLAKDALIIPSDVHDYLIDRQILIQSQFVTCAGGNILDDDHLDTFISAFTGDASSSKGGKHRKIAATFFFLEHVVAILRLKRRNNLGDVEYWYDFIDSLPHNETLGGLEDTGNSAGNNAMNLSPADGADFPNDRFDVKNEDIDNQLYPTLEEDNVNGYSSMASSEWNNNSTGTLGFETNLTEDSYIPNAARIRCVGRENLKFFLKWYACSKFSEENQAYISTYPWDDMKIDFDPRVFQAFVWTSAS